MLRLLREDIAAILKHQQKWHNEGFSSTQIIADFRKIIDRFRDYQGEVNGNMFQSFWKSRIFELHLVDVEYSVVPSDSEYNFRNLKKNLAIHWKLEYLAQLATW